MSSVVAGVIDVGFFLFDLWVWIEGLFFIVLTL